MAAETRTTTTATGTSERYTDQQGGQGISDNNSLNTPVPLLSPPPKTHKKEVGERGKMDTFEWIIFQSKTN